MIGWRGSVGGIGGNAGYAPLDEAVVQALAERLAGSAMRWRGRGLSLFSVDAGGCGLCLVELRMLAAPAYDLERHGLRFVASPREADVLLVSGAMTRTLRDAVVQAWNAMPDPKLVVALGDCAIDGGVFKGSYATAGGVDNALTVDVTVAGCPPTPAQVLGALQTLAAAIARLS